MEKKASNKWKLDLVQSLVKSGGVYGLGAKICGVILGRHSRKGTCSAGGGEALVAPGLGVRCRDQGK